MANVCKHNTVQVYCIGTVDSKLEELRFLSQSFKSNLHLYSANSSSKVEVTVVDVSTSQKVVESVEGFNFVSKNDVLSCYLGPINPSKGAMLPDDRGRAITIMNKALDAFLSKSHSDEILAGVIGLRGSGGTSIMAFAFRSLPIGLLKVIVSTVASGQMEPYIGTSYLVLFPSVVDICGVNSEIRVSNAASAFAGMVIGRLKVSLASPTGNQSRTVGITMFGVTTPCVNAVKDRLAREEYAPLVFHATSVGGRAMEDLVKEGFIKGVLDITTTEVADYIVGGDMACNSSQFEATLKKKIPLVLSIGALDMVNFG